MVYLYNIFVIYYISHDFTDKIIERLCKMIIIYYKYTTL